MPYENVEKTETKGIATKVLSLENESRNWAVVEKYRMCNSGRICSC